MLRYNSAIWVLNGPAMTAYGIFSGHNKPVISIWIGA
jgi:hypothetical protein